MKFCLAIFRSEFNLKKLGLKQIDWHSQFKPKTHYQSRENAIRKNTFTMLRENTISKQKIHLQM
jgi:hypothetical protein